MEATTTIRKMMKEGRIIVPNYQRAYSWEKAGDGKAPKQVDVFLSDLEEHATMPSGAYYFGHFLFENTTGKTSDGEEIRAVVDGQQRLTTITIFLAAVFARMRELGKLTEQATHLYEDTVKRGSNVRFETVEHDRMFFSDFVVEGNRRSTEGLPYVSQRRISEACDGIRSHLAKKSLGELQSLLDTVVDARCTTDVVENSGEAMQMFLFQNNRGKKPSKLEVTKALIMRTAYLRGGEAREGILRDLDARFSEIYRDLAAIEDCVDEDAALACAIRVMNKSLWAEADLTEIEKSLATGGIEWAEAFTRTLEACFRDLREFHCKETSQSIEAHALGVLGGASWVWPFVVKTFSLGLSLDLRTQVWRVLESLSVRHRSIGTKAYLVSRLNDIFQNMTAENAVKLLQERLKHLATTEDWWWAYWTDDLFKKSLEGEIGDRGLARFLLWRYENALRTSGKESGYDWKRYDELVLPELEHIAPQTATNREPVANGYGVYEDAVNPANGIVSGHWLDSIGNHLVLPKGHNCQIGNKPFAVKSASYTHSEQQREVVVIANDVAVQQGRSEIVWNKDCIEKRRDKIVKTLTEIYKPHV